VTKYHFSTCSVYFHLPPVSLYFPRGISLFSHSGDHRRAYRSALSSHGTNLQKTTLYYSSTTVILVNSFKKKHKYKAIEKADEERVHCTRRRNTTVSWSRPSSALNIHCDMKQHYKYILVNFTSWSLAAAAAARTCLTVRGDLEIGLDTGHKTWVDGVEHWVGKRDVARRSSGTHAIQLTEDTHTTTDIGRVMDTPADTHPTVLGTANNDHFVVRWTRHAERLRVTVLAGLMISFCG